MWKKDYIATQKVAGGVVIAAEKVTYPTELETPGVPLFRACEAIWEVLENVTAFNDVMEVDDGLVGELYGLICHLDTLATRIDARYEMEKRVREKTDPQVRLKTH